MRRLRPKTAWVFPEGYKDWTVLYVLNRSHNKQLRTIYGNDKAASVTDGGQAN